MMKYKNADIVKYWTLAFSKNFEFNTEKAFLAGQSELTQTQNYRA